MRYNTFENNESEEKKLRIFSIFSKKKVQTVPLMSQTKEYRVVRCDVPAGKPVFSPVWSGYNIEKKDSEKEKGWEKLMRIVRIAEARECGDKPFYTAFFSEKARTECNFCAKNENSLSGSVQKREVSGEAGNAFQADECGNEMQKDKNWFSDELFCGLSSLRGLNVNERGYRRF